MPLESAKIKTMDNVIWKPIFNGIFEVSSDGRVRRVIRTHSNQKLGELKASSSGRYMRLAFSVEGKHRSFSVHRLALLAFRGPCPEGMEGAHLNGNGKDNRIDNLAYVTHFDNEQHKRLHGTRPRGSKQGSSKLTEEQVIEIRRQIESGMSGGEMARRYNMTPATISWIRNRKGWTHV
jgi:hypothetical protein